MTTDTDNGGHGEQDGEIDWQASSSTRRLDLQEVLGSVRGLRQSLDRVDRIDDFEEQTGWRPEDFLSFLEDAARTEYEGAARPEWIDTGTGDLELPEPDHRGEIIINSHWSSEGYDWVKIALSMPLDNYEGLELRADDLDVEPADLMHDLVQVAGPVREGYYTGLTIDFSGEPERNL